MLARVAEGEEPFVRFDAMPLAEVDKLFVGLICSERDGVLFLLLSLLLSVFRLFETVNALNNRKHYLWRLLLAFAPSLQFVVDVIEVPPYLLLVLAVYVVYDFQYLNRALHQLPPLLQFLFQGSACYLKLRLLLANYGLQARLELFPLD